MSTSRKIEGVMPYVTEENLTDIVRQRWTDIPDPRLREVMQSLIKHLHAFVREVKLTEAELFTAIDFLTRTGKMCTDKRQEFILASDVLGVSMLVDAINHRLSTGATPTTVEGPFHVAGAPELANGADMAKGCPGIPCFVTGKVRGLDGRPIAGAVLDLWQTDGEGLYEAMRNVSEPWMRGLYRASRTAPTWCVPSTDRLYDPDGRHDRRTDAVHRHLAHAAGAHPFLRDRARLSSPGDAPVPARRRDHRDGRGVRREGAADRRVPEEADDSKAPNGETVDSDFYVVNYDFILDRAAETTIAAE